MTEYFLPRHVFFCFRGDSLVFLDLRHDDYVFVGGEAAEGLRQLLSTASHCAPEAEVSHVVNEMLESGLLTTNREEGKSATPTTVEFAMERLVDTTGMAEVCITVGHICRFIVSCTAAALRVRWGNLEKTARAVQRRKARHASYAPVDFAKARELTSAFHKLRSFFPRNYLCLYDSLALIEFLARYQVFPTWVFGIRLEPWAAHCWVQEASFSFNEGVEEAAAYTPIMAI